MADLITTANVFLEPLDYNNLTAGEKTQIGGLITAVSTIIERYCNRIFAQAIYTEEALNGTGINSLIIKNPPINSLTEITFVASTDETEVGTSFDISTEVGEIRWKSSSRITTGTTCTYQGFFPEGFRNILVTYSGGYSVIPTPIEKAAADMVMEGFSPAEEVSNMEAEKLGNYYIKIRKGAFEKSLIQHRSILSLYRNRWV